MPQNFTVYNVVPNDDYYYSNTTCHQCHSLQHYQLNSAKYFSSNIQLVFFPGVHHLHSDLIIENAYNILFIGENVTNTIIDCNLSGGIAIKNITNLVIQNFSIKNCQTESFLSNPSVVIVGSNFIKLKYVKIYHDMYKEDRIALLGINILGNSSLDHLTYDRILQLYYNETKEAAKYHKIFISYGESFNGTYAIQIALNQFSYALEFQISDMIVNTIYMKSYASSVKKLSNALVITNCKCQIEHNQEYTNGYTVSLTDVDIVFFKNCQFVNYKNQVFLVGIQGSKNLTFSHCVLHDSRLFSYICSSNIAIEHCKFNTNIGYISTYNNTHCSVQPTTVVIKNTSFSTSRIIMHQLALMKFSHIKLLLIGPVIFHKITKTLKKQNIFIISLLNCTVSIHGYVEFSHNTLVSLLQFQCVTEECFSINIADNASLIITNNVLGGYFSSIWLDNHSFHTSQYSPCFFQYLSKCLGYQGITCHTNYTILFNKNKCGIRTILSIVTDRIFEKIEVRAIPKYYGLLPLTHCYWLPHSSFTTATIPLDANKKYIKFKNNSIWLPEIKREKLLCYCNTDTHYDCYKEDLGYLYPGQTAVISFCYPLIAKHADSGEVIVDENTNQTHYKACIVYKDNEKVQITDKNCTKLYYTITFPTDNWCELFLKVPYNNHMQNSIFYVRQLKCPLGFVKNDGICQCYPLFKLFGITDCDINKQSVLRPANSWIHALDHDNYIISAQCPFHYCKTGAFYMNFLTSEAQCLYNRSGLLCGQCQHGLSSVLGYSNCQRCSNIYLLIIIPIAIAGLALVLLLFLLNLTVTDGTINGFILYANILSVNNTIFFANHQNTIAYVFISFANLDLGINTCLYNGMDDYAKMWLQLGFPFFLILIATLLIITSRYSSVIQKITSRRALAVLATLFLLSYTKILRIVCNVLFLYSSVTHLPSKHTTHVWSIDANIPLFGLKFILLFTVCLIFFLILVPFNIILLFTRTLSRFNSISKFKPLLDAYQGAYKTRFYYWTGLQLVVRTLFFGLSSLSGEINLTAGIITLSIINIVHTSAKPFKNNIKNYQEFLLILNLIVLYTFALLSASNDIDATVVNAMIALAVAQFSLIVMYHTLTYACNTKKRLLSRCYNMLTRFYMKPKVQQIELYHSNIPEVVYNYHEYQEPLIGQDYYQ